VLGGGRMGAGIAHAFLVSGSAVAVVERDEEQAAAARDRVTGTAQVSIDRGSTTESLVGRLSNPRAAGNEKALSCIPLRERVLETRQATERRRAPSLDD